MKKRVAIFDIDGTIFRSSLLIELVEVLIEKEHFPASVRKEFSNQKETWLDRQGDYEAYIGAVVGVFEANIKGIHYRDFLACAEIVFDRYKDRLYRYTRDLVQQLRSEGYYLLAISQSPKTVIDLFCTPLGFDKTYGRIYDIGPTDCLTGDIVDEHLIANKANIVKRAVQKENLTLDDSIGVGDTEGDITMLELVVQPICFNPNQKLYKHARVRGWKVVVERKDVIYTIQ